MKTQKGQKAAPAIVTNRNSLYFRSGATRGGLSGLAQQEGLGFLHGCIKM